MRDLMECQAEVFRRSEKRIKERKQRRNHILMVCIPLVFCAALAVNLWPTLMPANNKAEPEDFMQQQSPGLPESGESMFSNSVAVIGGSVSNSFTAAEKYEEITDILASVTAKIEEGDRDFNTSDTEDTVYGDESLSGSTSQVPGGYMVTVINEDGTATVYRLSDTLLVNQTTNEQFLLDRATSTLLNNALGIPQD